MIIANALGLVCGYTFEIFTLWMPGGETEKTGINRDVGITGFLDSSMQEVQTQ